MLKLLHADGLFETALSCRHDKCNGDKAAKRFQLTLDALRQEQKRSLSQQNEFSLIALKCLAWNLKRVNICERHCRQSSINLMLKIM